MPSYDLSGQRMLRCAISEKDYDVNHFVRGPSPPSRIARRTPDIASTFVAPKRFCALSIFLVECPEPVL